MVLLWSVEIGNHVSKHGDGAKDIAFEIEDLDAIFKVDLVYINAQPLPARSFTECCMMLSASC